MKVYLINQHNRLHKHLENFKSKSVMKYDKSKLVEKITEIRIETKKSLNELNLDFFFHYNIFPSNILIYETQWNLENRTMNIGDTIVQQAFLPPIKRMSQKVIFAVRINQIINEEDKKGLSYETIEGHVEKGISIFTIEQEGDNLKFKIQTFSEPGNFLTKLFGPIITVPYQRYCTKKALAFVRDQIEKQ